MFSSISTVGVRGTTWFVVALVFAYSPIGTFASRGLTRYEPQVSCSHYFREGSVRGSIFNLCSATLGAGALAIPSAFAGAGLGSGALMLVMGGLATIFSIRLLLEAARVTRSRSYEDLTVHVFGKGMGLAVEVCIIVFCFGTAIAYIVAVGDLLDPVIALVRASRFVSLSLCLCVCS